MTTFAAWPQYRAQSHIASRAWLSTFSADSGFTYTQTASHSLDTSKYVDGTGSVQVTGNTAAACETEVTSTSLRSYTGKWGLRFYIHDYTKVSLITLYLSKDTSYTNFVTYTLNVAGTPALQRNGWHEHEFTDGDANLSFTGGTFGLATTITRWKCRVTSVASQQATVNWDAVWCDSASRPAVLITADDGYETWYADGLSVLDTYGLKSTWYLIPSRLDTGGLYTTSRHVLTAYDNGHDIQVHGDNDLAAMSTAAEIRADVFSNQSGLEALVGSKREHYCYPNGGYEISAGDETIRNVLVGLGIKTARTVDGIATPTGRLMTPYTLPFVGGASGGPWNYPEMLRLPIIGHEGTYVNDTPTNILARIDAAIKSRRTCVLMLHKVGAGGTALEITSADLTTVIQGIYKRKQQGLIDVPTVSDWYRGLTQPALVS